MNIIKHKKPKHYELGLANSRSSLHKRQMMELTDRINNSIANFINYNYEVKETLRTTCKQQKALKTTKHIWKRYSRNIIYLFILYLYIKCKIAYIKPIIKYI